MTEWVSETWNISPDTQVRILYTLVVILILVLARIISVKLVLKRLTVLKDRYYWTRGIQYTIAAIGFVIIGTIWFSKFGDIATFVGLVSAGLTIALKDPIVNLAGWIFIIVRRPFTMGDRIQVNNHLGDVIDIRVFQFTINEIGNWVDADQSTGRIIHIPNGKVFTEPQANFTQGFTHIWNEIPVLITFESDWKKAKKILEEIAEKHAAHFTEIAEKKLIEVSKKYMILYNKLTPIVYTTVKESGVMLTIRYLITPRRRRSSDEGIWEDILEAFGKHEDINLAYPTQRIYFNPEDRPGS